ncbi:MAG: hypothetical protein MHMPM18_003576, partial [Marteilia pararefringens]
MCLNSCADFTKSHFVAILASIISVLLATRQIVIFGEHRDQIMCGYDAIFESNACRCNNSNLIHSEEQFICMSLEEMHVSVTDCKSNGNQIQFYDICLKEPPLNSWTSPNKRIWICRTHHIRRQLPTIHCSPCVSDQSPYQFYDTCLMKKPENSIWSRDSARFECNGLFMPDLESNTCPMDKCIDGAIKFYDVCLLDEPLHSEFDLLTSSFVCIEEYTRVANLCISNVQRKEELVIFDELITRTYKHVLMIVGSCVALLLVLYCCCKSCFYCCRKCCSKGDEVSLMKFVDHNVSSMRPEIENPITQSLIKDKNDLANMSFKTLPDYDYQLPKNTKKKPTIKGTLKAKNAGKDANINSNLSLSKFKRMKSTGNLSDNANTKLIKSFKEDIKIESTKYTRDNTNMKSNKSLMVDIKMKNTKNTRDNTNMKSNKSLMEDIKMKKTKNIEDNGSMKSNKSLLEDIKMKKTKNTEDNASMKSNKSLMEDIKNKKTKNTEDNGNM